MLYEYLGCNLNICVVSFILSEGENMSKRLFKRKKTTALILVLASSAIAITVFLAWFKPSDFRPANTSAFIDLPSPEAIGEVSVEEAIQQRRSIRSYADEPLSLQDISQLMWAAQGITDPTGEFRAAPSAGATYPLEVYVVVSETGASGLVQGLYRYDPYQHRLERILEYDLRASLAEAALEQTSVKEAPVNIVITAVYERTTGRYGERGVRYVHMEAGHVGQNLYLQATARGLGMVVVGAFDDDRVQNVMALPPDHKPLYIIPVGHPKD